MMGYNEKISSKTVNIDKDKIIKEVSITGDRKIFKDAFSQITLKGSNTDDVLVATGRDSGAEGGKGSDIVIGGTGNNPLKGNDESDYLIGDLLVSNYFYGNDILTGGPGNDFIEGGLGSDTFVFSPNDGTDIIAKFNVNYSDINNSNPIASDFEPGIDKIDLKNFNFSNFEEVISKFLPTVNGHAQFSYEGSNILFFGVNIEQFSEADFILI